MLEPGDSDRKIQPEPLPDITLRDSIVLTWQRYGFLVDLSERKNLKIN